MPYEVDGIPQIEVNELIEALESNKDVIFLDVREVEEYNEAHISGVKLLPTSQLAEKFEQELDREKEYIVICRSGNRSQRSCQFLKAQGFHKLTNYAGGMLEWTGSVETGNLPLE